MGGLTAGLLLRHKLTAEDCARIEAVLGEISTGLRKRERRECTDWESAVFDTRPIHFEYHGVGRLYSFWFQSPELEDYQLSACEKHFGFRPEQEILIGTPTSQDIDHSILGSLVLHFAEMLDAVIDFLGVLEPPRIDPDWDPDRDLGNFWAEVEPHFDQRIHDMPGKLIGLGDQSEHGRRWSIYMGDVEFMKAWIKHPQFHMIK